MVLLYAILLNACSKPDLPVDTGSGIKPTGTNLVSIALQGRVTDEGSAPVSGAMVRSGNEITTTDINGNFRFSTLKAKPSSGLVEISQNGFFRDFQRFDVIPEAEHFVQLKLVSKTSGQQFQAVTGSSYQLENGGTLQFSPDGITEAVNGKAYQGLVQLHAFSRTIDDEFFYSILPSTNGTDKDNKPVTIQLISAIVTELTGVSGEQLQLAAGTSAEMAFPIPASRLAQAPASISIWYFDPVNGLWVEEGKAFKEGNFYKTRVRHFSIWACGVSTPSTALNASITDLQGNALSFAQIQLFANDGKEILSSPAYATGNGEITMGAPANRSMEIRVLNRCGNVLATRKVNTGSSNNWLGAIKVGANTAKELTITGKVQNCKTAQVQNGWVTVWLDGQLNKARIANGQFKLSINRCYDAATYAKITIVDEDGNMESNAINMEVSSGLIDLGLISTCNKRNMQFVSYTMNGTNYLLQAPTDSLVQTIGAAAKTYTINCYKTDNPGVPAFNLVFAGEANPGEYPVSTLKFSQNKTQLTNAGSLLVKITQFGKVGEFIEGTATGNMREQSSNRTLPFNFRFKVIRNQ